MKPEIKKQIILHLPYLAFIYLFGKVGQAFRLAQGRICPGSCCISGRASPLPLQVQPPASILPIC